MKSASAAPEASTETRVHPRPNGRPHWLKSLLWRRKLLVDKRAQLGSVASVGLLALILLVPVNLGIHVIHATNAAHVAMETPQLVQLVEAQNRLEARGILIGSAVILLAAMLGTLLSTHRTAGAAIGLTRGIRMLREGEYNSTVTLRRGDRMRNVEREVNELSRNLFECSQRLADDLEREAEQIDQLTDAPEIRAVSLRLREMARQQRG